jgi:predicted RNase H-like HicB family nuclease
MRQEKLEHEISVLKDRMQKLESLSPIVVVIDTLTPEPYEVLQPFHVTLQLVDDEYVATFFDANISASGETQEEALHNLKDMIVAFFENLLEYEESQLGPDLVRQLKVLNKFIRKVE